MLDLKRHFAKSIGRAGAPLHFAAHSHHPWPDVTFDAQQRYWLDSAALLDRKWGKVFGEVLPEAQGHVARHLGIDTPETIVFAPNTHSLLMRLLSCLPTGRGLNILTTDGEFHSFARQSARLAEAGLATVVRVPVEPFDTFQQRFLDELATSEDWDLVWFSHVFFNSGWAMPAEGVAEIVGAVVSDATFAVVDGYHAFLALPVDLARIRDRAFYIAGGYKYAMAGEGACFMHCPAGFGPRPLDTGWFAEFGALEAARAGEVAYGRDASRFMGSTFDPSGIYRFNAAMRWMSDQGLTVAAMNAHCKALQRRFVAQLDDAPAPISSRDLVVANLDACGRFLTFRTDEAGRLDEALGERGVIVDHRGDRLRFGFGVYHDDADVDRLVAALRAI